ncbi:MAG TPA: sugar ABC transporter permease [Chloroflexota bacterium]
MAEATTPAVVPQPTAGQTMAQRSTAERRLFLSPALILVGLVTQIAFLVTIYYSMLSWNLIRPDLGRHFVGLSNYKTLLTSSAFLTALINTIVLTVGVLIAGMVIGLLLALLLNRSFPLRPLVRTLLITPFFVMPVATAEIWKNMLLNPVYGLIAWLLQQVNITPPDILGSQPLFGVGIMLTWEWFPFFMLILLGGLQSLPEDLIEAAHIDGAGPWSVFRYITIPHLQRYIALATLFGLIYLLGIFGEIFVGTQGGPGDASTNLPFLIYRTAFSNWDVGTASALAVIAVLITILIATAFNRVLLRLTGYAEAQ